MKVKMKGLRFVALGLSSVMMTVMLGACAGQDSKTVGKPGGEKVTIKVAYSAEEMDGNSKDIDEIFAEFYENNPNIKVVVDQVASNDSKLMAMIAANNAPDILRLTAVSDIPSFVSKGLLLPLDEYIEKSDNVDVDDLFEVGDLFKYDGKEVGKGVRYGALKDWSLDTQMWANKKVLAEAGVKLPEEGEAFSFQELAEATKKITKIGEGGQAERIGFYTGQSMFILLEWYLSQQGKSFWNEDFSGTSLLDSPETKEALQFFCDWHKSLGLTSPLAPIDSMQGWMSDNKLGFTNSGFYLSFFMLGNENIKKNIGYENVVFLPSPVVEKGTRFSAVLSGTGGAISAKTKHPEEAYKVWEYIHFGTPAKNRTRNLFGMPAQKSNVELLPLDNEYKQKVYDTLNDEMQYYKNNAIRVNPYVSTQSIQALFEKYYFPVIYGESTLDEACATIDKEARLLVEESKKIVGE